jgi:hypothetical protein
MRNLLIIIAVALLFIGCSGEGNAVSAACSDVSCETETVESDSAKCWSNVNELYELALERNEQFGISREESARTILECTNGWNEIVKANIGKESPTLLDPVHACSLYIDLCLR